MNRQILRKLSLIILPLLVIGIATYFLISSNAKEAKANVDLGLPFDLFTPYQTWPNSTAKKTGTAAEWLHAMNPTYGLTAVAVQNVDINGDGLVDILVHQESILNVGTQQHYFGVLLNRGDLTFDFAYKCVVGYIDRVVNRYYGDCAAL